MGNKFTKQNRILIDDKFKVTVFKGLKPVNIREMIDSFNCKCRCGISGND